MIEQEYRQQWPLRVLGPLRAQGGKRWLIEAGTATIERMSRNG